MMTDQDALRAKAKKLAAEKYPPVTVRGDDVFEAPRIAFTDGYMTRAAEPVTVSRRKALDIWGSESWGELESELLSIGVRIEGDEDE